MDSIPWSVQRSDCEELRELMVAEIPRLKRHALSLVRNRADADDLVQIALVRAIDKADLFQPGSNLGAWLSTILHNSFLDLYRRRRRAQLVDCDLRLRIERTTNPDQIASLQIADLQRAIEALPSEQRTTLLLTTFDNMQYEEVASLMNVPLGTVRSRLSRARASVQAAMEGHCVQTAADRGTRRSSPTSDLLIAKEEKRLREANARIAKAEDLLTQHRERMVESSRRGYDTSVSFKLYRSMQGILNQMLKARDEIKHRLDTLRPNGASTEWCPEKASRVEIANGAGDPPRK